MKYTTATLVILGLVVSACGSQQDGVDSYSDDAHRMYFEVPKGWHIYESNELGSVESQFAGPIYTFVLPVAERVGIDGFPSVNANNLAERLSSAQFPIGEAVIRKVGPDLRDQVSRSLVREAGFPLSGFDQVTSYVQEDLNLGGGYLGQRVLASYEDPQGGPVGAVYLAAVSDAADEHIYSIAVGCSRSCVNENIEAIDKVVSSWLVNVRQ